MNRPNHTINKDMMDLDLIDLDTLNLSDDQTWLCKLPSDLGQPVDIVDWNLSYEWPHVEEPEYQEYETQLYSLLDKIIKNDVTLSGDRQKFDSRTYVRPKRRTQRPSLQTMVEGVNTPNNNAELINGQNKYLTYNKYNSPLGSVSPMLRLKTFNVDTNSENSGAIKDYAAKRRSLQHDDDPQLEDTDQSENVPPTKPISIDYSQPAHYLHNTFNKGYSSMNDRGSLGMYQSGESLMRMSPPSLVSSILMDGSGNFMSDQIDAKKSLTVSIKDAGVSTPNRNSLDPMINSMTLSILDDKDMSTSFLSQTTYPDHDSLIGSLPPSLVSSVNSSFVVSNTSRPRESLDQNVFNSATFTHLEHSEKLLTARPRLQPYSFKREALRSSESYTKSKEEPVQTDINVLNEISDKKDSPKTNIMAETVTIHYSNNKFRSKHSEKENLNSTFEKDDAFYKDMGMVKTGELGKNSLNITMDKQELNEIIQARQKLSLARKNLPDTEQLPNQVEKATIQLPDQLITVPKQSMENASELLARRRFAYEREDGRDVKRNATFKKVSPKVNRTNTVVFDNNDAIDINSATVNLVDASDRTLQAEEWSTQTRAMVGSSESTDTATFSSSSPPESGADIVLPSPPSEVNNQVASTPLTVIKRGNKLDLLHVHNTISPIYDTIEDKSYTVLTAKERERTFEGRSQTVINSGTINLRRSANVKRDILAARNSPDKKLSPPNKVLSVLSPTGTVSQVIMGPPGSRSGLPASKLRQYSSHKELNRIPPNPLPGPKSSLPARGALRRPVYASNPVLSPTSQQAPQRLPNYRHADEEEKPKPAPRPPPLIRQGTETLRRERPQSQLVAPKDLRTPSVTTASVPMRTHAIPPPSRPYSIAGSTALRISRPTSVPTHKTGIASHVADTRPASSNEPRVSALPRPTRLPAPRRTLRPPSVYSVAPAADIDHY